MKKQSGEVETKQLVVKDNISQELAETMTLGDVFVKSGMFSDLKTQAQAVVKILAGKELGLRPLESLTNIYLVNGKVALQAKVIAALIKKSGKYDYRVEAQTETDCTIAFFEKVEGKMVELGKSTFTVKDAARAGIINKEVWKSYPKNMLFARALSNGARFYCPDVYSAYTPEELEGVKPNAEPVIVSLNKEGEVIKNGEKV